MSKNIGFKGSHPLCRIFSMSLGSGIVGLSVWCSPPTNIESGFILILQGNKP